VSFVSRRSRYAPSTLERCCASIRRGLGAEHRPIGVGFALQRLHESRPQDRRDAYRDSPVRYRGRLAIETCASTFAVRSITHRRTGPAPLVQRAASLPKRRVRCQSGDSQQALRWIEPRPRSGLRANARCGYAPGASTRAVLIDNEIEDKAGPPGQHSRGVPVAGSSTQSYDVINARFWPSWSETLKAR
jgi:hypothetical protein